MSAILCIQDGRLAGTKIPVERGATTVIGRSSRSTFRIDDPEMSRHHCSIEERGGKVIATDLGSVNGTWLNGKQIEVHELVDGDELRLGTTTFRVQCSLTSSPEAPVRLLRGQPRSTAYATMAIRLDGLPALPTGTVARRCDPALEAFMALQREVGRCDGAAAMAAAASRAILASRGPNRVAILLVQSAGDSLDCFSGGREDDRPMEISVDLVRDVIKKGVATVTRPLTAPGEAPPGPAACIPLAGRGGPMGCLLVQFLDPGLGGVDGDLPMLSAVGHCVAIALERNRLVVSLDESLVGAVRSLVAAVEARDPYTRGHSERVTLYSLAIGRLLNLSPPELEILEIAGLLHDVGKIAVPQTILHKPGALTGEEFSVIREHPRWSSEIVRNIRHSSGRPVEEAVLHHHERWDGKGYPDGLSGEALPLSSRILALGDTYDAMTSTRPYRAAMERERGLAIVRENAGTQFDPDLVGLLPAAVDSVTGDLAAGNSASHRSRYAPSQALHQLDWRD